MFCNQCGQPIPDDAMFCPGCGAKKEAMETPAAPVAEPAAPVAEAAPVEAAPVQQPVAAQPMQQPVAPVQQPMAAQPVAPMQQPVAGAVPPAAPEKKKEIPFKMLIPVAGVFVLLVIVLVAVLALGGGSDNDVYAKKELSHMYDPNAFYVFPNTDDVYECEEEYVENVQYNAACDRAIFTAYDDYDEMMLYYIDTDLEATLVAEDVNGAYISYTGEYILYLQDVEDNAGDLYAYCVKNGDITQIDSDVYPYNICMSPSGKVVCYVKDYESTYENTLYIGGVDKESVEIDDDGCRPLSVTDNGKYVYYVDSDYKLYLYNGKDSEKITSDIDSSCWVNRDATEILYTKDGKTYYHTVKMDEAVKIAGDELYDIILPGEVVVFYNNAEMVGLDTFKGAVLNCYEDIMWLNKKGDEAIKICSSTNLYQLSEDGKSILYVKGGDLYKIKKLSEDMEATVVCDEMYVEDFAASDDLSKIYIASDDELHYVKGENKFEEISNDLTESYYGYFIAYNEAMGKIFFVEDDTLCYAGTKEKSVEEVEEDVNGLYESRDGILFTIEDEDDYSYTYYYMDSKEVIELEID